MNSLMRFGLLTVQVTTCNPSRLAFSINLGVTRSARGRMVFAPDAHRASDGIAQPLAEEVPERDIRIGCAHALQDAEVKANHRAASERSRAMDRLDDGLFRAGRAGRLHLQIEANVALAGEIEELFDRRDAFSCKARPGAALAHDALGKPGSGIQLPQFVESLAGDQSAPGGGALQLVIMYEDHSPVASELQICLDVSGAEVGSQTKRRHRILRRVSGSPAMSNDPHASVVCPGTLAPGSVDILTKSNSYMPQARPRWCYPFSPYGI